MITASSTVKVWLKVVPKTQARLNDIYPVTPPKSRISTAQLVAILAVTIFMNLLIMHYDIIVQPCVEFISNWICTRVHCDSELGSYPGQGRQVSGVLAVH